MNMEQMVDYIHRLPRMEGPPTLARMQEALVRLGHPDHCYRIVHVAGTNGKGSTCALLGSVLVAAGYRTGLFTSPFLDAFANRIKVDGVDISETEMRAAFEMVLPIAEATRLTQFEFITALGLVHFAQARVDVVVLEVGLGGRYDATNAISSPLLSVITNIGYDHMAILGNTLAEIAGEKAAIIRPGVPVITAVDEPSAWAVIEKRYREQNAPAQRLGDDFTVTGLHSGLDGQSLRLNYGAAISEVFEISLLGRHQQRNAATAAAAALRLRELGLMISDSALRAGLSAARWPGRFEVMCKAPMLIMDGSHNTHGMAALRQTLDELLPAEDILWVAGMMADKDVAGMLEYLKGRTVSLYACSPQLPRALPAQDVADAGANAGFSSVSFSSVSDALDQALCDWKAGQAILVAGSLYLVSEARQHPFIANLIAARA